MIITEKKFTAQLNNPFFEKEDWLLFDIETTGFDRKKTKVVLVGLIYRQRNQLIVKQVLAEGLDEEQALLTELMSDFSNHRILITYNGDRFDIPYLNARYYENHMPYTLETKKSLDLYKYFRDQKHVYNFPNLKLKTIEKYLDIHRNDAIDGGESVRLYYDYLKNRDPNLRDLICLHNHDDICNLTLLMDKLLSLDPLFKTYIPQIIFSGSEPLYIKNLDITEDLMHIAFYPNRELQEMLLSDPPFLFDTSIGTPTMQLPILTFETGGERFIFLDTDLMFHESFDAMSAEEKRKSLIMNNQLLLLEPLENILKRKTDILL
jgi:hypothetical protein